MAQGHKTLQGNPDLMEVVEKRMRGEGGAIPTTASAKADVDKRQTILV